MQGAVTAGEGDAGGHYPPVIPSLSVSLSPVIPPGFSGKPQRKELPKGELLPVPSYAGTILLNQKPDRLHRRLDGGFRVVHDGIL